MRGAQSFRRMVLLDDRPPAWLAADSPSGDVVLASRARVARNLRGARFPHRADRRELLEIRDEVLDAFQGAGLDILKQLSQVEWEYFVGARLCSLDFDFEAPGRALAFSPDRSLSLMINEEDHFRAQGLTAGWSIDAADELAQSAATHLERSVACAHHPELGFLTASPSNVGKGLRHSAMFHLIGLGHQERLPRVLSALIQRGMITRGLFGEQTRAVGAFVQVSVTNGTRSDFVGACEYLINAERQARAEVGKKVRKERLEAALGYVERSPVIPLAEAVRVLAYLRWGAEGELTPFGVRHVDSWLSLLELSGGDDDEKSARLRADFLRSRVSGKVR